MMQLLTIFPMLQYDFMRHAFLAAVLIAPLFALLGTMAVNNKMAFFSDALGHSAFTGIGPVSYTHLCFCCAAAAIMMAAAAGATAAPGCGF